ncbi:MAG: ABC transporter permease [Anaerolineales bacterium]|nr:ABC transporter permease [Anaerolineales bacterium]
MAVAERSKTYDSGLKRSRALEELSDAFRYRHLIFQLSRRDVLTRYKRSILGVAWTMLNPLGMMIVLSVAFSQIFEGTRAYPAYVITGLVAWNFFAQTTTSAMNQMVWGGGLLSKIYIPRTVFVLSSIGTGLVNITLSLVPLLLVLVLTGIKITTAFLFLPISVFFLAIFSLGVGLILSTWAIYFYDVTEMYQIVLIAWMYLTPIIYPEEIVPEWISTWLFTINPMYHLVEIFRAPLYGGVIPDTNNIIAAASMSLLALVAGWIMFARRSDEFAYRV